MRRFVQAGLKVWVTELDVKMTSGCTETQQAAVYSAGKKTHLFCGAILY
jgi:GH35 family endo-1,4-beta-xylanase|eukprot:COSAG06_NODE_350_length_16971_cov_14.110927_21_plen_49_part_00